MEIVAPIINDFEIEFEAILKLEDMGLHKKSLSGSNFLKIYKNK